MNPIGLVIGIWVVNGPFGGLEVNESLKPVMCPVACYGRGGAFASAKENPL